MQSEPLIAFWEAAISQPQSWLALGLGLGSLLLAGGVWLRALKSSDRWSMRVMSASALSLALPALLYGPGLRRFLMVGTGIDPYTPATVTSATFDLLRFGWWFAIICGFVSLGLSARVFGYLRQYNLSLPVGVPLQPRPAEHTLDIPPRPLEQAVQTASLVNTIHTVYPRGRPAIMFATQCLIGSAEGCDVLVELGDDTIHATISQDTRGRWYLSRASAEPILLNGEALAEQSEYLLAHQDHISIGRNLLAVAFAASDEEPTLSTQAVDTPRALLIPINMQGRESGPIYPLGPHTTEVWIGRSRETCNLYLPGRSISRRHAVVHPVADGYAIADQGSTEGTLIAGRKLTAPERMVHGTLVRLGEWQLRFEDELGPHANLS